MLSGDLPLTSVNFLCCPKTFCQLPVRPGDLLSTSKTFCTARRPSVQFPCGREEFRQLLLIFRSSRKPVIFCQLSVGQDTFCQLISTSVVVGKLSVNFCRPFVRQGDLPSTSVNFPCGRQTFHHLLSTSDNFPCSQETFRHLLVLQVDLASTFRADWRLSINFCQISVQPEDLTSTFCQLSILTEDLPVAQTTGRSSVKFCELSVQLEDLPSNFCAAGRPSVNIH